jgi:hypothetical protein
MKEILFIIIEPLIPLLQQFSVLLVVDIIIFIIVMAVIYSIGRMLMLTNSDRIKNLIALVIIISSNYYFLSLNSINSIIINTIIHSSIGILLYVLIGFRLFDRVDDFLDTHFGKDKKRKIKK